MCVFDNFELFKTWGGGGDVVVGNSQYIWVQRMKEKAKVIANYCEHKLISASSVHAKEWATCTNTGTLSVLNGKIFGFL